MRSLGETREATTRRISGEIGVCAFYQHHANAMRVTTAYLVVGNVVVGAHALDLSRRQHPADIVDDLQVGRSRLATKASTCRHSNTIVGHYLLQLEELGGLH